MDETAIKCLSCRLQAGHEASVPVVIVGGIITETSKWYSIPSRAWTSDELRARHIEYGVATNRPRTMCYTASNAQLLVNGESLYVNTKYFLIFQL